ncbi:MULTISPECIES: TetR/AcrR family transcriptional regulator [Micrococcaceae]|jgi:AcrR family transcriptional regulator|uniref:TetR/AcrR family transcriptional regulator n=1 Tax=Paenarthrobacter aromaticivorans TaxID=2849150 RepID=A0ABS6I495_9MICC|nr:MULTISPECIES: TetR/AcrR family transcriptional regulator [Micrococcaceae]MBU8865884.1 TetR/AcrR family transcriptional regulator [Paenarthrobacter sp. MMS21-TAE1-1]BCW06226.1 TetR family transcriptional regulator [Arthrobacter sp. NtRootA1]
MDISDARNRIVATADELYNAKGIQAVGMDELRTAAGVSLKKLYQEFPSKGSIVMAVLERRHQSWTEGLDATVRRAPTPREQLLAIFDYLGQWFCQSTFRGCGFINSFAELGAISPEVAEYARKHKESFQEYVASLAAGAGAPGYLAPQLAILAEGAQTTAAIAGTPNAATQARQAAEVLIDAALNTK